WEGGSFRVNTMQRLLTTLLRRLAPPDDPSSDAAVLLRFVRHRDETAFELLVWRHGGLVMGVCRRMLRDDHLAEDAFQATFLILARKAGAVRGSLTGWLHQVARRVCLKARKRNPVPQEPGSERGVFDTDPLQSAELRAVLDEEIARLPEKQRLVVLLCYLQGRTTDDAAKFLGIPQGTVLSRLDAARKRLRSALTRRGVMVPVTLFVTALSTADVTAEVCRRATAAAIEYLNSAAVISVPSQLAHEVTQMTARKTALGMVAAVVMVSGVGTGVGLVMAQGGKTPVTKVADKPPAEPAKV
ncbi:MAG: sigma-70 family RNA polymerase sigma factor, partial [Gemmataceae bacterium]